MTREEIELELLYDKTDEIDEQILELQQKKNEVMEQVFALSRYMENKGLYYGTGI